MCLEGDRALVSRCNMFPSRVGTPRPGFVFVKADSPPLPDPLIPSATGVRGRARGLNRPCRQRQAASQCHYITESPKHMLTEDLGYELIADPPSRLAIL